VSAPDLPPSPSPVSPPLVEDADGKGTATVGEPAEVVARLRSWTVEVAVALAAIRAALAALAETVQWHMADTVIARHPVEIRGADVLCDGAVMFTEPERIEVAAPVATPTVAERIESVR